MIAVADPRRGAWVEVDLGAIATNVGVLAETVAPAALWVVVKADGYGHGAAAVARAALEAGAEGLCVAFVQEGAALRQSGILAPILVLSEQPAAQLDELVRWHLTATAYTPDYLDALAKEARETASPTVRVHLKVDTGMHRVGARPEQLVPLVQALLAHPELRWEGLWTHLARADEPADPTTVLQLGLLDDVVLALERGGLPAAAGPRRQLRRRAGVGPGRPPGPGAGRHRGLRDRAEPGAGRAVPRAGAGALAAGPGEPRATAGRRGGRLVRPSHRPRPGPHHRHPAPRLRRRGAPTPVRGGRRGAHRRPPPAHRRRRHDGPADGRLRRRPGRRGGRGRPARRPGQRADHRRGLGQRARHDRLRGGVRAQPPPAPPLPGRGAASRPSRSTAASAIRQAPRPVTNLGRRAHAARAGRRGGVDVHALPAERGPDPGRVRHGRPGRRPHVHRRGPGRAGGPPGPAVRRPQRPAARPAAARGARHHAGAGATSPTS